MSAWVHLLDIEARAFLYLHLVPKEGSLRKASLLGPRKKMGPLDVMPLEVAINSQSYRGNVKPITGLGPRCPN